MNRSFFSLSPVREDAPHSIDEPWQSPGTKLKVWMFLKIKLKEWVLLKKQNF